MRAKLLVLATLLSSHLFAEDFGSIAGFDFGAKKHSFNAIAKCDTFILSSMKSCEIDNVAHGVMNKRVKALTLLFDSEDKFSFIELRSSEIKASDTQKLEKAKEALAGVLIKKADGLVDVGIETRNFQDKIVVYRRVFNRKLFDSIALNLRIASDHKKKEKK